MNLRLFYGMTVYVIWLHSLKSHADSNKTLLCFYLAQGIDRLGDGRFTVDDIDTDLCTHIVYQGLQFDIITNNVIIDSKFIDEENGHEKFTELKTKNPQLKMLMALYLKPDKWNGANFGVIARKTVNFLQQYKFDGVVLQLYPLKEDKLGFTKLIKSLKDAFQPKKYLLIALGSRMQNIIDDGYDIENLSKDLDFLHLQVHGFHNPWNKSSWADHPAPLYKRPWDLENETIDFAVNYWLKKGFPAEKILLTISLWGISWTLSSNQIIPPAPAIGPGPAQKYTKIPGLMGYHEICNAIQSEDWQSLIQDLNQTIVGLFAVSPFSPDYRTWVGYDDTAMAVTKSEYVLSKGLGGLAVWDIGMDDFGNRCGTGFYPIITAIRNTLNKLPSGILSRIDIENLWFRRTLAFYFGLFVSTCSFVTMFYILFKWFVGDLYSKIVLSVNG